MNSNEWMSYKKQHLIKETKNAQGKYPPGSMKRDTRRESGFFGTNFFSSTDRPSSGNVNNNDQFFTQDHSFTDTLVYNVNSGKFELNPELIP